MKKIFPILLLAVLFLSCSDSKNDDLIPEPPGTGSDARLVGKWKVTFAKYGYQAVFVDNEEELATFSKTVDYVTKLGWNFGEFNFFQVFRGYPDEVPITGVFMNAEVMIDIKADNTFDVYLGTFNNPVEVIKHSYTIDEDGRFLWRKYENEGFTWGRNMYTFDKDGKLYMELRGNVGSDYPLEKFRASYYEKLD
ncbi:hypothetical protein [Dysgonomonas massiliensis]|uniref:hypothetical protein n=1 Tax=Dysgonomonas massiliensis TaxID=2040292 RepID=UPI000C783D9F|nr:hypothetical protein [Dysgonomonas massiliensis]